MAYFRRFELTQQSEWIEKGRTACERSAGLDQALAAAHVCLGTIRSGLGHYERAAAEFLKAIELDATSDAAYTGLGLAHQALGRPEEAEKAFEKAIALHPGYWAGHAWLGRFYFRRARYAEASRHLEQAIELAPDNPAAYSSLGGVYISMGRYEEAITALEKAIAIRPAFEAWANLGTAYYLMRRFDDAVQSFESAIASGAADCAAYVNLGRASQSVGGRAEKTLAAFRRANEVCRERLKVNPRDADAHLLLAYDHAMLDQPDVALAHLEDALAQRPAEPEYMFFAALVHSRLGHRDRAIEWLERAVVAGYSTAEIRSTAELDYLRTDVRFKTLLAKGRGPAS
jgi:tetratricopeptide (TPR) repeat protein